MRNYPARSTERLAGYEVRKKPVTNILDPIEISAVLLEAGSRRCLIFSFDPMIVGSPRICWIAQLIPIQSVQLDDASLQRSGKSPHFRPIPMRSRFRGLSPESSLATACHICEMSMTYGFS